MLETVSGFAGGRAPNPTYKQVTAGGTAHREAVRVTYDPERVSHADLVAYFWRTVDPTDAGGQFCDRGESYAAAIFAASAARLETAETSEARVEKALGRPVATAVRRLDPAGFAPAEPYHRNFHAEHGIKYAFHRQRCGRDARLKEIWGEAAGKWPPPDGR